jgi:hypothetical protein
MGQQVYQELFEVMKNRRGPYTGVEVPEFYPMVEELFTPQEAQVNNVMPRKPVTSAIDKNETIGVGTCYCRQASKLVGEDTQDMPMEVCMWFGNMAEYAIKASFANKT